MKNVINYYYNLAPEEIHQVEKIGRFEDHGVWYIFLPYQSNLDIKQFYDLGNKMLQAGLYTHQMIPNKDGNLLTPLNNEPYLLMSYYPNLDEKIKAEDLIQFQTVTQSVIVNEAEEILWGPMWSQKIDYFEYQVSQFGKRYPLIRDSFSFYVGIAENGIALARTLPKTKKKLVHRRIKSDSTYFDLYNPLNYVLDLNVRDSCEYYKDLFLNKEDIYEDVIRYFQTSYLTLEECYAFFVRLFYPSFYFDRFEEIMDGMESEDILAPIVAKSDQYVVLLKRLYRYFNAYFALPEIEWLKKEP